MRINKIHFFVEYPNTEPIYEGSIERVGNSWDKKITKKAGIN